MSLLFDALKRSDAERQANEDSLYAGEVGATGQGVNRDRSVMPVLVLIIVLLALIIAGLGWRLLAFPDPGSILRATGATNSPAGSNDEIEKPVPAVAESTVALKLAQGPVSQAQAPVLIRAYPHVPKTGDDVSALYQRAQQATATSAPLTPATPKKASSVAATEPAPVTANPRIVLPPLVYELPPAVQAELPSLEYTGHEYRMEGGSVVVINGQRLQAGATVLPGVRLDKIAREYCVLSFQGRSFRLSAMSSWINFQ